MSHFFGGKEEHMKNAYGEINNFTNHFCDHDQNVTIQEGLFSCQIGSM